jgi:hypothetical protein
VRLSNLSRLKANLSRQIQKSAGVMQYLIIPASSVSPERLFSSVRLVKRLTGEQMREREGERESAREREREGLRERDTHSQTESESMYDTSSLV